MRQIDSIPLLGPISNGVRRSAKISTEKMEEFNGAGWLLLIDKDRQAVKKSLTKEAECPICVQGSCPYNEAALER